jgi:phosphoglycolate phosphatase
MHLVYLVFTNPATLYILMGQLKIRRFVRFKLGILVTITNKTKQMSDDGQVTTRVVFFDMDHTLVDVSPFHRKNFLTVLNKLFGITELVPVVTSGYPMFDVVKRFAIASGISEGSVLGRKTEIERMLAENMKTILPLDLHDFVLPGTVQLLERLHANKIPVGLTTGSLRGVANQILQRASLLGYFPLTSFGDDCDHRSQIISRGLEKATWVYGLAPESIELVIVGDAAMDIEAGKAHNAITISVATGYYSEQELKSHEPDFVFPNLSNTEEVFSAIASI